MPQANPGRSRHRFLSTLKLFLARSLPSIASTFIYVRLEMPPSSFLEYDRPRNSRSSTGKIQVIHFQIVMVLIISSSFFSNEQFVIMAKFSSSSHLLLCDVLYRNFKYRTV